MTLNQRLPGQPLLLLPLTTSSSSSSSSASSSSSSPSSSWSSAVVTWTQKRPLMTKQTFPPPHLMFQWRLFLFSWCGAKKKYYILTEIWNQEMFIFQLPKFEWPTSLLRLHWGKEQLSNSSHRLGHTARNHSLPPMCKLNRAAEPVPLQWTTHDHKAF